MKINKLASIKNPELKTIRDNNKVALSSRNSLLSKKQLKLASGIYKNLFKFKKSLRNSKNVQSLLEIKKKEIKKI